MEKIINETKHIWIEHKKVVIAVAIIILLSILL